MALTVATFGGDERISGRELVERIDKAPENFNPNALFRPVVQDYLLPTLVYTGGAAEIAYFAQAAVVYEKLLDGHADSATVFGNSARA